MAANTIGNKRGDLTLRYVFEDDTVRASFLSILDKTSDIHDWISHALLPHGQPLSPPYQNSQCESVNANQSKGKRQLNGESLTRKSTKTATLLGLARVECWRCWNC
jgi:hypothetical protein